MNKIIYISLLFDLKAMDNELNMPWPIVAIAFYFLADFYVFYSIQNIFQL